MQGLHSIKNVATPGVNVVVDKLPTSRSDIFGHVGFANIYCLVEECFSPWLTLAVAD